MAPFKFMEWLFLWLIEAEHFLFDWNRGHLTKSETKHQVLREEVERVFKTPLAMPLGIQVFPKYQEERLGIVGQLDAKRMIMVAFTLREGKVRPISARPASLKERKSYENFLREIT